MAITLFGSASTPADNGTNTTQTTAVTPPASMVAGDLVWMTATNHSSSGTVALSELGGQAWTSLTQTNGTTCRMRNFWCVFNGSWSANPSVDCGGTTNNIVRMLVFRPGRGAGTGYSWAVDAAGVQATYAAPASPYTVTIPEITTAHDDALVIATWASRDDTTWGSLSGSSLTYIALSPTQVRNTSGSSDGSQSHAWVIAATAGATGTVSQNQASGGDPGARCHISFYETGLTTVPAILTATGDQPVSVEIGGAVNVPGAIAGVFSTIEPTSVGQPPVSVTPTPDHIAGVFSPANNPSIKTATIFVPSEMTVAADQPTPTAGVAAVPVTVTPAPIDAVTTQPTLSLFAQAVVAIQSAISGLFSQLVPAMAAACLIVPAPVMAQATPLGPAVLAQSLISPAPIVGTFDLPAPSVSTAGNITVVPSPITGEFAALTPTISAAGNIAVSASPIEGNFSQPGPTLQATATVIPGPVDGVLDQPAPSVLAGGNVTAVPSPITGTFSAAGSPSVVLSTIYTPAEIAGAFAPLEPTINVESSVGVTPTPAPIVGAFSQSAPTVIANARVVPEPIFGAFGQSSPTTSSAGNVTVSVNAIAGAFSQSVSTVIAGASIVPAPIAGTGALVEPSVAATRSPVATPDPIVGTFAPLTPSLAISGGTTVVTDPISGTFNAANNPAVRCSTIFVPAPITGKFSQGVPVINAATSSVTVSPVPLTGRLTQPYLTSSIDAELVPVPVTGQFSQPSPAINIVNASTVITPAPVTGTFSQPASIERGSSVKPVSPIAGSFSTPGPAVFSGGSVTLALDPIYGAFEVNGPAETGEALVSVGHVAAEAIVAAPSVEIDEGVPGSPTPDVISASAEVVEPTVSVVASPTCTPSPIDALAAVLASSQRISKDAAVEPVDATASVVAPTVLIGSAHALPDFVSAAASMPRPTVRITGTRPRHPFLKDVVGRKRIIDAMRADGMQDAAERVRIVDIYLGRKT